jgi:hypothetical protein
MADRWLDDDILKKALRKPILLDTDSDIEMEPEPARPRVTYDPRRLTVTLPETGKFEQINYVPPKLNLSSNRMNPSSAAEPHFLQPPERFDVFEHFQFEWIEIPELAPDSR